jgi:hypothetical protein
MGSGVLIQTLMRHDRTDEYCSSSTRWCPEGCSQTAGRRLPFRRVDSTATTTGVLIASYQRADSAARRDSTAH